jgi:hypothetical protein
MDEAEIGEVRFAIGVPAGKISQGCKIWIEIEGDTHHPIFEKSEHDRTGLKVECGFGEDRFTGQQWLRDSSGNIVSPGMVLIVMACEAHDEAGIGDSDHLFSRKPFAGGQVARTAFNDAGVPHETPLAAICHSGLQLLADQAAHGDAGALRGFLEPVEKVVRKADGECVTHGAIV